MRQFISFWPLLFFVFSVLIGLILKIPLYLSLGFAFVVITLHCLNKGISIRTLLSLLIDGISSIRAVLLLLSIIMMVIPIWIKIGTIPTLLVFGFEKLNHQNLIVLSFVLSAFLSMTIGTAMGTMSILMASLLTLGIGAGIPAPIIVGSVVSGAYIGDRSSLMSGSVHLNASITETQARTNVVYMMRTLIPGFLISLGLYYCIGLRYPMTPETLKNFEASALTLRANSSISLFYVTPLFALIGLIAIGRMKMIAALSVVTLYSYSILLFESHEFFQSFKVMLHGYELQMGHNLLLKSTGLLGIAPVLGVILFSTLINQLLDALNLIKPLLDIYLTRVRTFFTLTYKVGILSFIISLITCSQTLMIVICGQHIKPYYDSLKYDRRDLMLTIADFGIITVALIPWNVNGQMIEALTGISTLSYLPYTFVCLLMPLMNFLHSILKRPLDNDSST